MTAFCQPLPRSAAEEMLKVVARALCDRAGDSSEQRDSLTRQMVLTTLGLAPRDGLEFMLATLAFGHFQMILDAMSDVFGGQTDALKAKTRAAIVPLGRAMLQMLKELRVAQMRPVLQAEEDVAAEAEAADTAAPPPDEAEAMVPEPEPLSEAELASLSDPRLGLSAEVIAWVAGTAPAVPRTASHEAAVFRQTDAQSPAASPGARAAVAGPPFDVLAATG